MSLSAAKAGSGLFLLSPIHGFRFAPSVATDMSLAAAGSQEFLSRINLLERIDRGTWR